MEASYEGDQGPEGAVAPYMDGNNHEYKSNSCGQFPSFGCLDV